MNRPKMPSIWTFESLVEYVRTAFAHRDEVQRIAHEEAVEVERKVEKLRDEVELLRPRLLLRDDYERRHGDLQNEAANRALAVKEETLQRIDTLADIHRRDIERTETRLAALENWKANLAGRATALALIGGILVAVVAAVVTHLVS